VASWYVSCASLPGGAAGTEKASTSPALRGLGTRVPRICSSTGQASFSLGLIRPCAIVRRVSALNMFAKRSVAEPKMTMSSPSRKWWMSLCCSMVLWVTGE